MKDGTPMKGKKGLVHFKGGQLKAVEYEAYLKEQAKVTVISIEKKQEIEFKELIEKSKTEKISEKALIRAFETGQKKKDLATEYGVTTLTIGYYCNKFFHKSFKSAKQAYLSRKKAVACFYPETVEMPLDFEDRILGTEHKEPRDITDKDGNYVGIDLDNATIKEIVNQIKGDPVCPILSNEVASGNWRGYLIESDRAFHQAVFDLPYYAYNPVKRLRRAALSWLSHGDFDQLMQSKDYFGESKGLIYLKVRFAQTHDELYLTHDGGLIISEKASYAMSYNFVERDQITNEIVTKIVTSDERDELEAVIKTHPADKRIEAGEVLTKTSAFPTDGYMLNPEIKGRKHFSLQFEILKRGQIGVGDKLLGLTGLKGIVSKVDPDLDSEVDIVINPNQIFGEKASRKCGSAIKEIKKTGRIAIFYQPRQLASSRFSGKSKKVTVSSTAYPFIALYGSEGLQSEILKNRRLADLFYAFDLVLNEKGKIMPVNRQAEARAGGNLYPFDHQLWKKDFIKKEIWLPKWLPKFFFRRRRGTGTRYQQTTRLFETIGRLSKIGKMPVEEITEEKKKEEIIQFSILKKEIMILLSQNIAPEVEKGRSNVIAVAKKGNPGEIELTKHDIGLLGIKVGNKILLRREPVVSKDHIQEFTVKETADRFQQNNTVKIVPEAIRLMAGDIDGDPLIFMCYGDSNFKVSAETYAAEKKNLEDQFMKDFDIEKIDAEDLYKVDSELLNLAKEEHIKLRNQKYNVPHIGGLRKSASFTQDSITFEREEVVDKADILEEGLKDTMPGKFATETNKKNQLKIWSRAAKGECAIKLLWKKFEEGKLKGSLLDDVLGMKFLPNDKSGLYQLLISEIERVSR